MKRKLLSILCAVAILMTSLFGVIMAATATDSSSEAKPSAKVPSTITMDTDSNSVYAATYAQIDSLTPMTNVKSVSVNQVARGVNNYDNYARQLVAQYTLNGGETVAVEDGYMFYIDTSSNPSTDAPVLFQMIIKQKNLNYTANISGPSVFARTGAAAKVYYLMDDGTEGTTWTTKELPTDANATDVAYGNKKAAQGVVLPAGFKGYLYIPNDVFQYEVTNAWKKIAQIDVSMLANYGDTAQTYKVSAPMIVSGFDSTTTEYMGDSKTIDLDTNEEPNATGGGSDNSSDNSLISATIPANTTVTPATVGKYVETLTAIDSLTALNAVKSVSYSHVARYVANGLEMDNNMVAQFDFADGVKSTGGFMVYVDVSAITDVNAPVIFQMTVKKRSNINHTANINGPAAYARDGKAAKVYYFVDDAAEGTTWGTIELPTYKPSSAEVTADPTLDDNLTYGNRNGAHGVTLPVGFKGYLYIPAEAFSQDLNSASAWNDIGTVVYHMLSQAPTDANKVLKVSAPMSVSDFDTEETRVVGDACALNLDTNEVVELPSSGPVFVGDIIGATIPANTTVTPATVGKYTATLAAIDSLTALNTVKSISYSHVTRYIANGLETDNNMVAQFDFADGVKSTGGFMVYVDTSTITEEEAPVIFQMTVKKRSNINHTANINGPAAYARDGKAAKVYYFVDDAAEGTTWGTIELPTYKPSSAEVTADPTLDDNLTYGNRNGANGVTLPAGFKGYLYIPAEAFSQDLNSASAWNDIGTVVYHMLSQSPADANKIIKVSAPMSVSRFDAEETRVVGDACALDLDTNTVIEVTTEGGGDVTPPGGDGDDDDDDQGGGTVPPPAGDDDDDDDDGRVEPDYDLPAYDGEALDYTGVDVAKAWVARLNAKVFIGEEFAKSAAVFKDGATGVAANSLTGITNYPVVKITSAGETISVSTLHDPDANRGATVGMVYVKLPKGKSAQLAMYWNFKDSDGKFISCSKYTSQSGMYLMPKGSESWSNIGVTEYFMTLPEGYEGYVRYNFTSFSKFTDASNGLCEVLTQVKGLAANDEVYVSAPILVDKITDDTVPNAAFIGAETKVARNFITGEIYEFVQEPDYDLPAYTGTALDYSGAKVAKAWVARLNERVYIGEGFTGVGLVPEIGTEYVAAKSQVGITNYPTIKMTAGGESITLSTRHDADANRGGSIGMYYVKLPAGKSATIRTSWNFHSTEGVFASGSQYGRTVKIMPKGTNYWISLSVKEYLATLPAGFEGYVRYDFTNLACYPKVDGGTKYWNDTYGLCETLTTVAGLSAGDVVYVSAPILVTEMTDDTIAYAAFIGDETKVARNFITGEIYKFVQEPDYDLPAYTGTALDYSGTKVAKAWVAKLNERVYIGEGFTGVGLVPEIGTEYVAAKSQVGITNYPTIKMTAGGESITLSTRHDSDANRGGSIGMYYVKLPAGKSATIRTSWNFHSTEGVFASGSQYGGSVKIMPKGTNYWVTLSVKEYLATLPAGFEGYVRYDFARLGCYPKVDGSTKYWNDTYGLCETLTTVAGLSAGDVVYVSAPILVTEMTDDTIAYAAFIGDETKVARKFITGEVFKYIPEPNYDLPLYKGETQKYDELKFMDAWVAKFTEEVHVGQSFVGVGVIPELGVDFVAAESQTGLTKYPTIKITSNGNMITIPTRHDPEANRGADGAMYYVKLPTGQSAKFRTSWCFHSTEGVYAAGSQWGRTVKILAKGEVEWSEISVKEYLFELPEGFEGYVRYDFTNLGCYPKINDDTKYWNNTYGLCETQTMIEGLKKGQVVYVSAPIMLGNVQMDSEVRAVRMNKDTKAVRNIFTGEFMLRDEYIPPLEIGVTIKNLPKATTELKPKVTDKTQLGNGKATIEWTAFEGAASYKVRVFRNMSSATGIVYTLTQEYDVTETKVELTGLTANTRYAVVVYAYDAAGKEIAIYDYVSVSTAGAVPVAPVTPDTDDTVTDTPEEKNGLSTGIIIAIVAGVVVLAGAVVVVILVLKKKRTPAEVVAEAASAEASEETAE